MMSQVDDFIGKRYQGRGRVYPLQCGLHRDQTSSQEPVTLNSSNLVPHQWELHTCIRGQGMRQQHLLLKTLCYFIILTLKCFIIVCFKQARDEHFLNHIYILEYSLRKI